LCTLREAITAANTNTASGATAGECVAGASGLDSISFTVIGAGCSGLACTIAPGSGLPTITEPVLLDATTQQGYAGSPLIRIDWTVPAGGNGLSITSGGSTVKGFSITHFSNAVFLTTNGNNTIQGNWLGLDLSGAAAGNGYGVEVNPSSNNLIGGTTAAQRNVISANGIGGVHLVNGSSNNVVSGNYIGTDAAGTASFGNGSNGGVYAGSNGNTIGGTAAGAGNVIAGNYAGVWLWESTNNIVQGNFIGTDKTGMVALGNGGGGGIGLVGNVSGTTIGGSAAGARNVISANTGPGINLQASSATGMVIQGNYIGTDAAGTGDLGNGNDGIFVAYGGTALNLLIGGTGAGEGNVIAFNGKGLAGSGVWNHDDTRVAIRGNSIHSNKTLGIDLGYQIRGVTLNDPGDADTGPNNLQNFPVLTTASSTAIPSPSTTIVGTLNSAASTDYQIDFYSNASCNSSGYGEGQTYLGSKQVTTDGSGNASFSATFPVTVSPQARLTATATDPNGNTSEFCSCLSLQAKYHTITPCRVADTRTTAPPALAAGANRTFVVGGQCGIPAAAQAVAFNFTITQPTALGDLRIFTGGGTLPLVSTMNYRKDQTRANNGIVPLGPSGDIVVHVDQSSGTVHFVMDVNGYFQ
ncbi:MAG: hypothetical protein ACRD3M_02180, partial [Thermoanaerobaculia bacterium]